MLYLFSGVASPAVCHSNGVCGVFKQIYVVQIVNPSEAVESSGLLKLDDPS